MISSSSSFKRLALKTLDYGCSFFIITPLLVSFWYSTWSTFDLLANTNQYRIILFVVGLCGQFAQLYHHDVPRRILNVPNQIASACLSRFYVLICGIVNICFWRLVWISYDLISTNDNNSIALNVAQNATILMALRVFVNSISIPFFIAVDDATGGEEQEPPNFTYMKKSKADGIAYTIDCLCTMLITAIIICLWRDIWTLAGINIYPNNELYSALISTLIGYFVASVCFIIHPCVSALCEAFDESRIFYHDAYVALCLLATLNVWRGLWMLSNILVAGNVAIIFLLNVTSWLLLILMGCSNSLSIGSILIDAEGRGGKCLEFQHDHISSLLASASRNEMNVGVSARKANEIERMQGVISTTK